MPHSNIWYKKQDGQTEARTVYAAIVRLAVIVDLVLVSTACAPPRPAVELRHVDVRCPLPRQPPPPTVVAACGVDGASGGVGHRGVGEAAAAAEATGVVWSWTAATSDRRCWRCCHRIIPARPPLTRCRRGTRLQRKHRRRHHHQENRCIKTSVSYSKKT